MTPRIHRVTGFGKPRMGIPLSKHSRFGIDAVAIMPYNEGALCQVHDYAQGITALPLRRPDIVVATGTSTTSMTTNSFAFYKNQTIFGKAGTAGNIGARTVITAISGSGPWTLTLSPALPNTPATSDTFEHQQIDPAWTTPKLSEGWNPNWGWGPCLDLYPNNVICTPLVLGPDNGSFQQLNHRFFYEAPKKGYTLALKYLPANASTHLQYIGDTDATAGLAIYSGFPSGGQSSITLKNSSGISITNDTSPGHTAFVWEAGKWIFCIVVVDNDGARIWANQLAGVQVPYMVLQQNVTTCDLLQTWNDGVTRTPTTVNGHWFISGGWSTQVSTPQVGTPSFQGKIDFHGLWDRPFVVQDIHELYRDTYQMFDTLGMIKYFRGGLGGNPAHILRPGIDTGTLRPGVDTGTVVPGTDTGTVRTD